MSEEPLGLDGPNGYHYVFNQSSNNIDAYGYLKLRMGGKTILGLSGAAGIGLWYGLKYYEEYQWAEAKIKAQYACITNSSGTSGSRIDSQLKEWVGDVFGKEGSYFPDFDRKPGAPESCKWVACKLVELYSDKNQEEVKSAIKNLRRFWNTYCASGPKGYL